MNFAAVLRFMWFIVLVVMVDTVLFTYAAVFFFFLSVFGFVAITPEFYVGAALMCFLIAGVAYVYSILSNYSSDELQRIGVSFYKLLLNAADYGIFFCDTFGCLLNDNMVLVFFILGVFKEIIEWYNSECQKLMDNMVVTWTMLSYLSFVLVLQPYKDLIFFIYRRSLFVRMRRHIKVHLFFHRVLGKISIFKFLFARRVYMNLIRRFKKLRILFSIGLIKKIG